MPSINKADRRDNKRNKRKNGMVTDSRSVFTIQNEQDKRAKKIKRKQLDKNSN